MLLSFALLASIPANSTYLSPGVYSLYAPVISCPKVLVSYLLPSWQRVQREASTTIKSSTGRQTRRSTTARGITIKSCFCCYSSKQMGSQVWQRVWKFRLLLCIVSKALQDHSKNRPLLDPRTLTLKWQIGGRIPNTCGLELPASLQDTSDWLSLLWAGL